MNSKLSRWLKSQAPVPRGPLTERQLTLNSSEQRVLTQAISPDGNYLAYSDIKGLHLRVVDSGEVHEVSLGPEVGEYVRQISWLPDGEKLVYLSRSESGGMVIWLVSILGGAPRKLRTHCGSGVGVASQAPLVAFTSENEHELWVMGTDGEDPHKILGSENDFYRVPAWSPTGKRLAFIRQAPSGGSEYMGDATGEAAGGAMLAPVQAVSPCPGLPQRGQTSIERVTKVPRPRCAR